MDMPAQSRRTLCPEIEPYDTGMLDVGDGHPLYWERCGTPGAKPAAFLHGGPGRHQPRIAGPVRSGQI